MQQPTTRIERALEQRLIQARQEGMRSMGAIEHRLEFVDVHNGVEYINDAKATDPNSTWYSIESISQPTIWIMSVSDFQEDLALYAEFDASSLRAIIVMADDLGPIEQAFGARVGLIGRVDTIGQAVQHAMLIAEEGDVVLFSPSCESYKHFQHYKEAGQQFRKAVRESRL